VKVASKASWQILQLQLGLRVHVCAIRHVNAWLESGQLHRGRDHHWFKMLQSRGSPGHGQLTFLLLLLLLLLLLHQVVGCDGAGEQRIATAVQAAGGAARIIFACTQVPEASSGTPQGAAAELQQLQEAHDAVAAFNKRQLTVYAVQPDASAIVQRRRLQSSNADVGVCGQLCRVSSQQICQLQCCDVWEASNLPGNHRRHR
jgi:predicted GNAT family acetyltransferase